jgi:transposase-like protein
MASKSAPETLREAILFFADYDNCRKAVEAIRWPNGVVTCPTCGSDHVTYLATQRRYKCYVKHPKAQFSLKVGTIFEDSAIGLEKWLPALWLLTGCKNGISSYELARALGVTQKTAWFMLSRLRLALHGGDADRMSGHVEADETFIGATIHTDALTSYVAVESDYTHKVIDHADVRADEPERAMEQFTAGLRVVLSARKSRSHEPTKRPNPKSKAGPY